MGTAYCRGIGVDGRVGLLKDELMSQNEGRMRPSRTTTCGAEMPRNRNTRGYPAILEKYRESDLQKGIREKVVE